MEIEAYLNELEKHIDERKEIQLWNCWLDFTSGKLKRGAFLPSRSYKAISTLRWPEIQVNEAVDRYDRMLLDHLSICSNSLTKGSGDLLCVRCNYGTGIIPSMFGANLHYLADELNTLPSARPVDLKTHKIEEHLKPKSGKRGLRLSERVFVMVERFIKAFESFPKIQQFVHIYPPDIQGPANVCQILMGSNFYLDVIENKEFVHEVMEMITDTIIDYLKKWYMIVPPLPGNVSVAWGMLHPGKVMIRDDVAMNLSPELFEEFILPYDRRIFSEFGGGAIHTCGRCDHYIHLVHTIGNIYAMNLTQPEMNDMNRIYKNTIDRDIQLIGLDLNEITRAESLNIDLKGNVHGRPDHGSITH